MRLTVKIQVREDDFTVIAQSEMEVKGDISTIRNIGLAASESVEDLIQACLHEAEAYDKEEKREVAK